MGWTHTVVGYEIMYQQSQQNKNNSAYAAINGMFHFDATSLTVKSSYMTQTQTLLLLYHMKFTHEILVQHWNIKDAIKHLSQKQEYDKYMTPLHFIHINVKHNQCHQAINHNS